MSKSILVVDDFEETRLMISTMAERTGYTVFQAESGEAALLILEQTPVDLVISDIKMPGMDGISLAKKVLSMDPNRPVILITGYADVKSARDAVGIGIYGYFTKPFDLAELRLSIHRALEHRQLTLENLAYQESLERKVEERTRKLTEVNERLQKEVVDRKKAEREANRQKELVSRVIESLPHPFVVIDAHDYGIAMANSATYSGTCKKEKKCYALFHGRSTPCEDGEGPCTVREVRKTKKPIVVDHIHQNGGEKGRTLEVHGYPIFDHEGNVIQVIEYAVDVTERRKAEESDRIKKLSEKIIAFQEEERKRVARELHDEIGQVLAAIKLILEMIEKDHSGLRPPARKELEEAIDLVTSAIGDLHRISSRLRPEILDNFGLVPSIEYEVDYMAKRSGIKIEFSSDGLKGRLTPEKEIAVYRVVQEALTNIIKHSQAKKAGVSLREQDKEVRLRIRDNGRGFEVSLLKESKGLGVLGMRERIASAGGVFQINSGPGRGTLLEARVPLT